MVIYFAADHFCSYLYGILDGFGIGTAMTDYSGPGYTEQWSTAVFRIINPFAEFTKGLLGQQITHLCHKALRHFSAQHGNDCFSQPLAHLQADIADKAVTDNDVDITLKNIPSLNIADEI
jgi:hypothetical protein